MARSFICFLLLFSLFPFAAGAETVRIGGNGTFSAFMARMAAHYKQIHPDAAVAVLMPPLGSAGGLLGLSGGRLEISGGIRPLTAAERAMPNIGAERFLGTTPFVLLSSHPQAQPLDRNALAAIYAGKTLRWPDGSPIRLVLRSRGEGVTMFMRSLSPEISAALDASFERKGMVIAENDLDTMDLAERSPGSLAPSTLLLARLERRKLTVLPLESADPASRLGLWLTAAAAAGPETAAFLAFLETAAAREMMIELGLTPHVP